MAAKIQKFVFQAVTQEFGMPNSARVLHVKINRAGSPAFYAMVEDDVVLAARTFVALQTGEVIPKNWNYVGSACNGEVTFHIGEIFEGN